MLCVCWRTVGIASQLDTSSPLSDLSEIAMELAQFSEEMQQCLNNCLACYRLCTATAAHVMHGQSARSEAAHLVSLLDCAQICSTHADFMLRRSPHTMLLASECEMICTACATQCEAHHDQDGIMLACAEACRKCAASCALV